MNAIQHAIAANVEYQGDVSIQYGGMFYTLADGAANAVRVAPCSDAGGPDNCFWVESLAIDIDRSETELKPALECIGAYDEYSACGDVKEKARMAVTACEAYGLYDVTGSLLVQLGKDDEYYSDHEKYTPMLYLRAGSDLAAFALHRL